MISSSLHSPANYIIPLRWQKTFKGWWPGGEEVNIPSNPSPPLQMLRQPWVYRRKEELGPCPTE
jgi:hypothetical protein